MANVPFLTPTSYVPPRATPTPSPSNAVEDLIDYLNNVKEIPKSVPQKLKKLQEEIEKLAKVYTIDGVEDFDLLKFLQYARQNMTNVLKNNRRTKVKMVLRSYMEKLGSSGAVIKPVTFHSNIEVSLDGTDEEELYDTMVEQILEKIAAFQSMGSGCRFHSVTRLELHTIKYKPLNGETYIPLPEELAVKKAIINMKNDDNKCFLWSILWALNPKECYPKRVDMEFRKKENTLNMRGIEYPVSLKDLGKYEKQNPSLSITVLGHEEKGVYPLRISDRVDRDRNIILLLIEGVKHYCLVKSLCRLLSSQV